MLFTQDELRRLEEWVTWGIEKKGLKNEDLQSAHRKLRQMLAAGDAAVQTIETKPCRRAEDADADENARQIVAFLTKMVKGRPLTDAEGSYVRRWIGENVSCRLVAFAWDASVKNCGGPAIGYMDELIRRELKKEEAQRQIDG